MLEHRIEARYEQSMAAVFAALVRELGSERWLQNDDSLDGTNLPRAGLRFGYRQARRFYFGQVLECLRPVSIVIVERYQGPAGSIVARQRWRLDPVDRVTRLSGRLRIETNHFARLQLRFWSAHFRSRAQRTCNRVGACLNLASPDKSAAHGDPACRSRAHTGQSGSTGQSSGSISIVRANTTRVKGKPILR